MRHFVRHPSDIPIEVVASSGPDSHEDTWISNLKNVSFGGLRCTLSDEINPGTYIDIIIRAVQPQYSGKGVVVWCAEVDGGYDIGIQFLEEQEAYKSRMVEQVCQIEHYRNKAKAEEGREIDCEQAAREWIERYAEDF